MIELLFLDLRFSFGHQFENVINPIDSAFDGDHNVDVLQNGSHVLQGIKQQRCSRFKATSKVGMNNVDFPYQVGLIKMLDGNFTSKVFLSIF